MTCIVSYNILAGGYSIREDGARRTSQLTTIIRSAHPDVVGLIEATHPLMLHKPTVIEEIAAALDMQLIRGGAERNPADYELALLTRLPVVYTKLHKNTGVNKTVMEVCVEESKGQRLTIFLTHLTAAFNEGRGGGHIRIRETQELLRLMAPLREQGQPHLLMGDFNSLAPGDHFQASELVNYVIDLDGKRYDPGLSDGHPQVKLVVPPRLRFLSPLLHIIPRSRLISSIFNAAASLYAPRGNIRFLHNAGYIDCYRQTHPHARGFTCPAAAPAGRIDFIFASPELASQLNTSYVLTEGEGVAGKDASDHLAVAAEFSLSVPTHTQSQKLDNIAI